MKKRLSLVFAASIAAMALAFAQDSRPVQNPQDPEPPKVSLSSAIQGAWKLVEKNGAPYGLTQIKIISGTRWVWTRSNADGHLMDCAGGTYTLEKDIYTETIDTSPAQKNDMGKSYACQVMVVGDTFFQLLGPDAGNTFEVYERIK